MIWSWLAANWLAVLALVVGSLATPKLATTGFHPLDGGRFVRAHPRANGPPEHRWGQVKPGGFQRPSQHPTVGGGCDGTVPDDRHTGANPDSHFQRLQRCTETRSAA